MKERKVAVVTGANRGLGLATSEELAKQGYTVFMVGRDIAKTTKAAEPLKKQNLDVRPFEADVTETDKIEKLASTLRGEFGKLDVLVNNAGVYLESGRASSESSVFKVEPDTVLKTFEINTLGPLRMVQALIPLLRESPAGRIVNVSSGMGQLSEMQGTAPGYRISKTGLNALTRVLAAELSGTNVKVNSVCPGWVKTDMGGQGASREIDEG